MKKSDIVTSLATDIEYLDSEVVRAENLQAAFEASSLWVLAAFALLSVILLVSSAKGWKRATRTVAVCTLALSLGFGAFGVATTLAINAPHDQASIDIRSHIFIAHPEDKEEACEIARDRMDGLSEPIGLNRPGFPRE